MARSAFTTHVVYVDYWELNAPTGAEVTGDIALVGAAPSGDFAGHANEIAIKLNGAWHFSGPSANGGLVLFRKAGSPANRWYGYPAGSPPKLFALDVGLDVLTTRGDLIRRGASAPERVALGSAGQLLGSDGTDALWVPGLTTRGDLLTRDASVYKRLALGAVGFTLQSDGTDVLWASPKRLLTAGFHASSATGVGAQTIGFMGTTSNDAGIPVPSGRTLKVWYHANKVKTGATVGSNYDLEGVIAKKIAATVTQVSTLLDQSNDQAVSWDAIASDWNTPLASVAGPEFVQLGWGVLGGSTGALASAQHSAMMLYSIE
jgi:hypothetical protein